MDEFNNAPNEIKVAAGEVLKEALQPSAKEIGKSLATVAKTVNIVLAPISMLVWGYDQFKEFIEKKVSSKLMNVSVENIISPDPKIVGPAFETLRYSGGNESIQEMFANLIANSMDMETSNNSHPAFVEILKNICGDEALIIKEFQNIHSYPAIDLRMKLKDQNGYETIAENISELGTRANCKVTYLAQTYIQNLCRLGILEIPHGLSFVNKKKYDNILNSGDYLETLEKLKSEKFIIEPVFRIIRLTTFGELFIKTCVYDKQNQV